MFFNDKDKQERMLCHSLTASAPVTTSVCLPALNVDWTGGGELEKRSGVSVYGTAVYGSLRHAPAKSKNSKVERNVGGGRPISDAKTIFI